MPASESALLDRTSRVRQLDKVRVAVFNICKSSYQCIEKT